MVHLLFMERRRFLSVLHANDYIRNLVKNGDLGAKTGKGFYDWSQRSMEDDMRKRDQFIIEAVKIVARLSR